VNSLSKNQIPIEKDDMLRILCYGAKSLFEEIEQYSKETLKWEEKSGIKNKKKKYLFIKYIYNNNNNKTMNSNNYQHQHH